MLIWAFFGLELERWRGKDLKIKDLGLEGKICRNCMMRDGQLWE